MGLNPVIEWLQQLCCQTARAPFQRLAFGVLGCMYQLSLSLRTRQSWHESLLCLWILLLLWWSLSLPGMPWVCSWFRGEGGYMMQALTLGLWMQWPGGPVDLKTYWPLQKLTGPPKKLTAPPSPKPNLCNEKNICVNVQFEQCIIKIHD